MNAVDQVEILQRLVNARGNKHSDEVTEVTAARIMYIMYSKNQGRATRRLLTQAVKTGLISASRRVGHRNTLFYRATVSGEALIKAFHIKPQFTDFAKYEFLADLRKMFPQSPILNAICDDYQDK